jgi:hypothetical protein
MSAAHRQGETKDEAEMASALGIAAHTVRGEAVAAGMGSNGL